MAGLLTREPAESAFSSACIERMPGQQWREEGFRCDVHLQRRGRPGIAPAFPIAEGTLALALSHHRSIGLQANTPVRPCLV